MKYFLIFLIPGLFFQIVSKENNKCNKVVFIYFENNVDGMAKIDENKIDSTFYYTINLDKPYYWYGFEPKEAGEIVTSSYFESNIKDILNDISWIRQICKNNPDSLSKNIDIKIVQKNSKEYKVTKCNFYRLIE